MTSTTTYFSISAEMILIGESLPYSLYINSSSLAERERFVRIARRGEPLTRTDLQTFVAKYSRIYLRETERADFLKSLAAVPGASDPAKTKVLKDAALENLKTLFEQDCTPEVIEKSVRECRAVVDGMVDVIGDYEDVDALRDLISDLSFHDFYTYDHSINVGMYTILIFRLLHPEASRTDVLQAGMAGLLHDLGKVRISNEILNKAGKLTEVDLKEIRRHPGYGAELIAQGCQRLEQGLDSTLLGRIIFEHHENFDGTGYPRRIRGTELHELSRIVAIADFFDAVTTKRSYHEPLNTPDAVALMSKSRGIKLDPELFDLFCEHVEGYRPDRVLYHELPPDFDACQPCCKLPLITSRSVVKQEGSEGPYFGKIHRLTDLKEIKKPATGGVLHPGPTKKSA